MIFPNNYSRLPDNFDPEGDNSGLSGWFYHPTDEPFHFGSNRDKNFFVHLKKGKIDNGDLPACFYEMPSSYMILYFKEGFIHREGGPALIQIHKDFPMEKLSLELIEDYISNNKIYNLRYYINEILHNLHGPASITLAVTPKFEDFYIHGKIMSMETWKAHRLVKATEIKTLLKNIS